MKLITANVSDIQRTYRPTKYLELLQAFVVSGMKVARVEPDADEVIKVQQTANAIRVAIKRFGFNCQVVTRKSGLYLVAEGVEA